MALQDLTGGVAFSVGLEDVIASKWQGSSNRLVFWEYLRDRFAEGSHMGVSKHKESAGRSNNILCGHSYGVLRMDVLNNKKLIQIRNPWGQGKVQRCF